MVEVQVSIYGIIMCCDESISSVSLGGGYTIEKCDLNSLPFKDKIMNGSGQLSTDYFGSRIIEDEKTYFMCLKKENTIEINGPSFTGSSFIITDKDCMCEAELSAYMDKEINFINERINLLRLFKNGNIGYRDIFLIIHFKFLG